MTNRTLQVTKLFWNQAKESRPKGDIVYRVEKWLDTVAFPPLTLWFPTIQRAGITNSLIPTSTLTEQEAKDVCQAHYELLLKHDFVDPHQANPT